MKKIIITILIILLAIMITGLIFFRLSAKEDEVETNSLLNNIANTDEVNNIENTKESEVSNNLNEKTD